MAGQLAQADVLDIVNRIMVMREREQDRLRRISNYMRGKHDSVYSPEGARSEYEWIKRTSKVNYLPLIISVISENLDVDGYRPTPKKPPKPTGQITVTGPTPPPAPPPPPALPAVPQAPPPGRSGAPAPARPAASATAAPAGASPGKPKTSASGGTQSAEKAVPETRPAPAPAAPPAPPAAPAKVSVPASILTDDDVIEEDNPAWDLFVQDKLISKQHGLHRAIAKYGLAYTIVLPGKLGKEDFPVIRCVSPKRMTALYEDDVNDEWPIYAIEVNQINSGTGSRTVVKLYDDNYCYTVMSDDNSNTFRTPTGDDMDFLPSGNSVVARHGLGVCPVIRFLHDMDLDGEMDVTGEVEPQIHLQDQINQITSCLGIAMQFASFRQRWIAGMVPNDEKGRPRAPFSPGVDRPWVADDPTTKFGEFGQTDLKDYIAAREKTIQHIATISQVPPYHMLGLVANLSAEALAAARDGLDRKIQQIQGILAEPWKQTLQLAALANKDKKNANDIGAEVAWRDTSARAFSATVDAWGKAAALLGIPAEELWEKIPGVSAQDVARWKIAASRPGVMAQLNEIVENALTKGQQPSGGPGTPGNGPYQSFSPRPGGV